MVTFFCSSCGQYLKKKQAEQHVDFCNDKLSCNDCKKIFTGFEVIKAHVKCEPNKPSKQERSTSAKDIKVSDIKWSGFKKTLRLIVKRAEGRKINRDTLKRLVLNVMKSNGEDIPTDFDATFKQKLSSAKNLKQEGLFVKYNRS